MVPYILICVFGLIDALRYCFFDGARLTSAMEGGKWYRTVDSDDCYEMRHAFLDLLWITAAFFNVKKLNSASKSL